MTVTLTDATKPVVSAFQAPATAPSRTVGGLIMTATNNFGVVCTPDIRSITLDNLAPGMNTIVIAATDALGNSSTAKRTVTSDTTAPTLEISTPSQDGKTTRASSTVGGKVTDAITRTSVAISVTNDQNSTVDSYAPAVAADGSYSATIQLPVDGNYTVTVTVTATDQAGNQTTVVRHIQKNSLVDIATALHVLRIAVGLDTATADDYAKYDVAPLANGKPTADGVIDVRDVILVLEEIVGTVNW